MKQTMWHLVWHVHDLAPRIRPNRSVALITAEPFVREEEIGKKIAIADAC